MPHVADQIVAAIKTKLTGLALTGSHVYDGEPRQLLDAQLPALILREGDEAASTGTVGFPRLSQRTLQLGVQIVVKDTTSPATLRTIRANVETALGADPRLVNLSRDLRFTGKTGLDLMTSGERTVAAMTLNFDVDYAIYENDPNTPR